MKKKNQLSSVAFVSALLTMPAVAQVNSPVQATLERHTMQAVMPAEMGKSIVSRRKVAPGIELRVLKDSHGALSKQVFKTMTEKAVKRMGKQEASPALQDTQDDVLFESFEGWNGEDWDWLPETWSEQVSDQSLIDINGNSTWHVNKKDLYHPEPVEGQYHATINYAVTGEENVTLAQNEWLITPAFVPVAGTAFLYNAAYTPFFLFDANNFDWETLTFSKMEITATLKLHVSVDGGEWKLLWDASDAYKNLSGAEFYEKYMTMKYYHYSIDLTPYAGKNVKFAFQYVGKDGNAMDIDYVRAGVPAPTASYRRPTGAFYFGVSDNFLEHTTNWKPTMMLMPAYTDFTWRNMSNIESENFMWKYQKEDGSDGMSSDRDLTMHYGHNYTNEPNYYRIPTLIAGAKGAQDHSYIWQDSQFQVGGQAMMQQDGNNYVPMGVSNYDKSNSFFALVNKSNEFYFGNDESINEQWTNIFEEKAHLTAVCNLFEQPQHAYALSKVTVMATGEIADDTELKLKINAIDEDGRIEEMPLARATCKGADVKKTLISGKPYLAIPFELFAVSEGEDEEEVLTRDTLTIETAILVTVEGFDKPNCGKFGFFQSRPDMFKETNGYFVVETYSEEGEPDANIYPLSALSTEEGKCYSSFLFNLDANYSWIEDIDEDLDRDWIQLYEDMYINAVLFDVPMVANSKEFKLVSSENPEKWEFELLPVTDDYPQPEDETPDWLTVTKLGTKADAKIVFNFKKNTSGEDRSAYYYVHIPGARALYMVRQLGNASAIDKVNNGDKVQVSVVQGNFVVNTASPCHISIFNIAGQEVANLSSNGNAVIPAQHLSHGMYVLRLSDGTAVKVMK